MLVEALARLSAFGPVATEYQYVGFGSPFFVDFRLFHRRLAITRMVSIEKEVLHRPRFDLNKPFDCIEMKYGESAECLPEVDWAMPSIVWLDFDNRLRHQELADVERVVEQAKHGDCLLTTVDADPPQTEDEVERIRDELGRAAGQLGSPEALSGWRLADLYYDLLREATLAALRERGGRLEWQQIFRFYYKESARMLTYGGVFVDPVRSFEFEGARFGDLPFVVMADEDPFVILMPQLTLVETGRIDRNMPDHVAAAMTDLGAFRVREEHVRRYARIYRHAPTFHESQV
jgi:hypothetical protein